MSDLSIERAFIGSQLCPRSGNNSNSFLTEEPSIDESPGRSSVCAAASIEVVHQGQEASFVSASLASVLSIRVE
jgi:hypothetical protein